MVSQAAFPFMVPLDKADLILSATLLFIQPLCAGSQRCTRSKTAKVQFQFSKGLEPGKGTQRKGSFLSEVFLFKEILNLFPG